MSTFQDRIYAFLSHIQHAEEFVAVIDHWAIQMVRAGKIWDVHDTFKLSKPPFPGIGIFPYSERQHFIHMQEDGVAASFEELEILCRSELASCFAFGVLPSDTNYFPALFPLSPAVLYRMVAALKEKVSAESPEVQLLTKFAGHWDYSSRAEKLPLTWLVLRPKPMVKGMMSYDRPKASADVAALNYLVNCVDAVQGNNILQFCFNELMMTVSWRPSDDMWNIDAVDELPNGAALPDMLWVQRHVKFHGATIDPDGFGLIREDASHTSRESCRRTLSRYAAKPKSAVAMLPTTLEAVLPALGNLPTTFEEIRKACAEVVFDEGVIFFHRISSDCSREKNRPAPAPKSTSVYGSQKPAPKSPPSLAVNVFRFTDPND